MKPVVYNRLAAGELIKSAKFYERQNPTLGDAFLSVVEATLPENSAQSRTRQNRQARNAQLENKTIPVPNCLPGTAGSILDCSGGAPESQTGLLDSATALIFLHHHRREPQSRAEIRCPSSSKTSLE